MFTARKELGFSLVELAIVLSILGLVFVGAMTSFGSFKQTAFIKESQSHSSNIKKQILNFGLINKYLPCPDTNANGFENRITVSGSLGTVDRCASSVGTVPYLDLGLIESDVEDGWGNKLRYAVNTNTTSANLICDKTSSASMFCNSGSASGTFWFTLTDTPPFASDRGLGNYFVCNDNAAICTGTPVDADLQTDSAVLILVAYNEDGSIALNACGTMSGANNENCDTDEYYHQRQLTTVEGSFFDDVITTISGYEVKAKLLSSLVSWNSYTPTNPSNTLTPTYEDFDITESDTVPISNTNSPDVILVNRNVSADINLQNGDDYIAIGNNLEATLNADDGDDQVYIVGSALGNVLLGNGDDQFVLGSDLTESLNADDGSDKVWIQGNVNSGSSLNLGDDDDVLWIGNGADPSAGNISELIEGGSGEDILVLENFTSEQEFWGATPTQYTNISNFEYIIFADDGSGVRSYCTWGVDCDGTNN